MKKTTNPKVNILVPIYGAEKYIERHRCSKENNYRIPEISHALTKRLIRTSLLKDNNLHYAEGVNLDEKLQICAPIFFMQSLCMGSRKSNGTVINRMT